MNFHPISIGKNPILNLQSIHNLSTGYTAFGILLILSMIFLSFTDWYLI